MKIKQKGMRILAAMMALYLLLAAEFPGSVAYAFDNSVKEGVVAIVFAIEEARWYYTWDGINFQRGKVIGDIEYSSGSGFFIGTSGEDPQYIVTNEHVIDDYVNANEGEQPLILYDYQYDSEGDLYARYISGKSCELRVYYSQDEYEPAYVDSYGDKDKVDLAVLRLRNPTDRRRSLTIMEPTEDMVGDQVYTVGYPGNADNELTDASKYGIEDASVHSGNIVRFVANSGKGVERISIDATAQHGNSGGPLVIEDGYVIGVTTNVISNSPYKNQIETDYYAISATELTRFLDKNSIPYETADSGTSGASTAQEESDPSLGTAEDGIAAVDNTPTADDSIQAASGSVQTAVNEQAQESSSGGMILVIIFAVVAVLAVIAVAALIVVRKSRQKPGSAAQGTGKTVAMNGAGIGPTMAASATRGPVAHSLALQHNNLRVPIGAAPVMVGRDRAQCAIVYAEGTPGVSSRHCTISFDLAAQAFTVMDIGSTYGTFLMNGQRLQPNVPCSLKMGESFYVGDKGNMIRLELG